MAIGRVPGETGIQPTIVDAKGDIIAATAADSVTRLAVGTNEHRLVADSATATGLKYVADTTNYAVAAKGDLLVGTAADTVAALTVGSANQVLTVDSSTATGLKWATPAGGKVLQVVNASTNTQTTSSTTTWADTTLTATITPTSSTSKILVFVSQVGLQKQSSNTGIGLRLMRGATSLMAFEAYAAGNLTTTTNIVGGSSITYLDSPATTSATTYKTQFQSVSGTASVTVQSDSPYSTITLMEIGA